MGDELKVCRLCLETIANNGAYSPLTNKSDVYNDLKIISYVTFRNLDKTKDPIICSKCEENLKTCASFKKDIIANEALLLEQPGKELRDFLRSISESVDKICRLCLKPSEVQLTKPWRDCNKLLLKCTIHMNVNIITPSKICVQCNGALNSMSQFILQCIDNEKLVTERKVAEVIKPEVETVAIMEEDTQELQLNKSCNTYRSRRKPRKINYADIPSTSKNAPPEELLTDRKYIMKKMNEKLRKLHTSIDCSPAKLTDTTLNSTLEGLVLERCESEFNATQELIDVLEGRLKELDVEIVDPQTENQEIEIEIEEVQPVQIEEVQPVQIDITQVTTVRKRGRPKKIEAPVKKQKVEKKLEATVEVPVKKQKVEKKVETNVEVPVKKQKVEKKIETNVVVIKSKKRTKKAVLEKTWQELLGKKPKEENEQAAGSSTSEVEIMPVPVPVKGKGRVAKPPQEKPKHSNSHVWIYCEKCNYRTYSENVYIQHLLIHNIRKTMVEETLLENVKCDRCRFETTNPQEMEEHKMKHVQYALTYMCIFCVEVFRRKTSCMYHTLRHDDKDVASQFYCSVYNSGTEDEYYECFQCAYNSVDESTMPDHVIDHAIEKPKVLMLAKYKCDKCSFRTKSQDYLEHHMKIHERDDVIKKQKNSGAASKKIKIKNEINEEDDGVKKEADKPEEDLRPLLSCDKCHYVTRHPRSLANHIGVKHTRAILPHDSGLVAKQKALANPDTPMYYCNDCSYKTHRKENLPRHVLVHKNKLNLSKLFECHHCLFETKHQRSYTRHMEAVHGIVV